jgi:hypothetical protein
VDFVLLDARDLRIRVVVELDEKTHGRAGRREGDALVDRALGQAGVPVVRVAAAAGGRGEAGVDSESPGFPSRGSKVERA